MKTTPAYVGSLDGLRAIAVLAVVGYHADLPLTTGGFIGVDVFFVLSGFLITGILFRERTATGRISLKSFYVRRALRLFPAVLTVCAVVAVLWTVIPAAPLKEATLWGTLAAATYSSSWVRAFDISSLAYMGHTWSLSVEEIFYFVWPLALIAVFRTKWRTQLVLAITLLAIAYRLAAPTLFGWSVDRIYNSPDTRAEQLLIGCALAALLSTRGVQVKAAFAWVAGAVLVAAVAVLPLSSPFYWYGGSTVIAICTAVIVAHLWSDRRSVLSRTLSTKPLVWVGRRSYGIYLWHRPIFGLLFVSALPLPVIAVLGFVLALLVPALSYRFIELPFLRMKDRYSPPRDSSLGSIPPH